MKDDFAKIAGGKGYIRNVITLIQQGEITVEDATGTLTSLMDKPFLNPPGELVPTTPEAEKALVRALLRLIGEDPDREGLQDTPRRFLSALREYCSGYGQNPQDVLKAFEDGAELCGDELVVVRDLSVFSMCEHHIAPFWGKVHIGYIPDGKVLGLSKFARLTDIFAHRLQVQERLTNQIANALQEHLKPVGVGVVIEATHSCMCGRGVKKEGSTTVTSALRGALKDKPAARAEFFELIWGSKR